MNATILNLNGRSEKIIATTFSDITAYCLSLALNITQMKKISLCRISTKFFNQPAQMLLYIIQKFAYKIGYFSPPKLE